MIRVSPFARSYLRNRSAQLMTDACAIYHPVTLPVTNQATQQAARLVDHTVYSGPCRVWQEPAGSQVLMGDELITSTNTFLSVPYNAPQAKMNDVVLITSSDDVTLVSKSLKIVSVTKGGGLRGSRVYLVQALESHTVAW